MDSTSLAAVSASVLSSLLSGAASGISEASANQVYSQVSQRLRKSAGASSDALNHFEQSPTDPTTGQALRSVLEAEFQQDSTFAHLIESLVIPQGHSVNQQITSTGSGIAAGRDVTQSNKKTNYGGLVVAAVAIAAILMILLLGGVVVAVVGGSTSGGLSGDSTCTEFLTSSDQTAKAAVMRELYVERNKPRRAADPFLLQNADAICSTQPIGVTLAQVADVAREFGT